MWMLSLGAVGEIWQWVIPPLIMKWIIKFTKLGIKKSPFRVFGPSSWSMSPSGKLYLPFSICYFTHLQWLLDGLVDVLCILPFLLHGFFIRYLSFSCLCNFCFINSLQKHPSCLRKVQTVHYLFDVYFNVEKPRYKFSNVRLKEPKITLWLNYDTT